MDLQSLTGNRTTDSVRSLGDGQNAAARQLTANDQSRPDLRKTFDQFVGETFYGQMLKALRSTVKEPAYFNGGQAEKMFREQLDQTLAQQLAENSAGSFTGPMFELFELQRK
jgi:Rod binding domain-containing protein